jgi:hypothetical protein
MVTAALDNGLYTKYNFKEKNCVDCGNSFKPKSSRAFRCGSRKNKTGCSYKNRLDLSIKSQMINREYRNDYMYEYNLQKRVELTQYRKEYYDSRKEHVKNQMLFRNYGITLDKYNEMLAAQNYVCAICEKTNKDNRSLHVDHDHKTGSVRSLLCSKCNTSIGLMDEDKTLLSKAIKYLESHGK